MRDAAAASKPKLHLLSEHPRVVLFEHDLRICYHRGNMVSPNALIHRAFDVCTCRRRKQLRLAKSVAGTIFLTSLQRRYYHANPWYVRGTERVLGCSVFSQKVLESFRSFVDKSNSVHEVAVLYSGHPGKGFRESLAFAKRFVAEPYVIKNLTHEQVLHVFGQARRFVYLPRSAEWAGRMLVEARFIGCEIVGNKRVGVMREAWWNLPNNQALAIVESAAERFWSHVASITQERLSLHFNKRMQSNLF